VTRCGERHHCFGVPFIDETGGATMFQKVVTVVLIGSSLALAACNTVRGAARDVSSVANCTEDLMKQGKC
jgi:predicted small secreted protein